MNHILFLMETKDLLCSRQEHIPGSLVLSQYSKPQRPFQGTAPVGGEQSFVRFHLCTPTRSHLSVISFQLFSSEYFQNLGNYQCQFPLKNKCLKNVDLFFFFWQLSQIKSLISKETKFVYIQDFGHYRIFFFPVGLFHICLCS